MSGLIENGRITSADIVFSRGFILDCNILIEFEASAQGFGGYVLGGKPFSDAACAKHEEQPNLAADWIAHVMAIADVEAFSKLPGKVIRVERETPYGRIVAIGHAFKDRWYRPDERIEVLRAARTVQP